MPTTEKSDPTQCSGEPGPCPEHGYHAESLKQNGEPEPDHCLDNPLLTARLGYPVRCPHCPPDAGPVPATHWTKHVQRHHPEALAPADRAAEVAELRAELKTYRYVSLNNAVLRTENRVLTEALDEAGDKIERLRADRAAVLREGASRLDARAEELDAAAKTSCISGLRGVRDARLDSAECWRGAADEVRRMADEVQDGAS